MPRYAEAQDRWHRRWRKLLHPVDFARPWFYELGHFYRHLSKEEFWLRYHTSRCEAQAMWAAGTPAWNLTDYYVLRQAYYHRDSCFHAIAARLPKGGTFLEYGCGIAPISAWLVRHRPDVYITFADVTSRTLEFAQWRLPTIPVWPIESPLEEQEFDVIACFEVMEHVPAPMWTIDRLIHALKYGGSLMLDYVAGRADGGGSDAEREAVVVRLLSVDSRHPLHANGGKGVYVRR